MNTRQKMAALAVVGLGLSLTACGTAEGDSTYPSGAVELVIPWDAGGSSDLAARLFGSHLEDALGTTVTAMNIPGANGAQGWADLAASEPDGNTIGLITYDILTNQAMDPSATQLDELDFLMQFEEQPLALYVHSEGDFQSVDEIVEADRQVTFGTSGLGGVFHQGAGLLAQSVDREFSYVPFDGSGGQLTAMVGQHVDAIVISPTAPQQYVEDGTLLMLAVFADERSEAFPDVPTFQELGYDVPAHSSFRGIAAPKGLDDEVRTTLVEALKETYDSPEFQTKAEDLELQLTYLDSEEFTGQLNTMAPTVAELLTNLGLTE
ncbi:tripartite tricarboxylate transporter substrate binding protein [Ornithinimicrobium cavernae]|uniref:tripartite tricarboxylate transporter substrate binding protein n=1 Tax=Ornithinimicrobium cavernae TaxID=2666047 RepID=UPI000D69F028|nr:tripartite tricarboxylate transporter substrate binding protein [Ornithinimicrobium cavernae]